MQAMSQLGTELIPHGVTDTGIPVVLMYSKISQQVLFLEAGKDFVDLVVGFLTLPIGCIIKLLSENGVLTSKTGGSIANFFESIQRLEGEETLCTTSKSFTDIEPMGHERDLREGDLEPCNYFTCGAKSHCSFVSPRYGAKCPRHHKKMTTQCKVVDGCTTPTPTPTEVPGGYVKSSSKYFVTDNLEVFPSSNSLALLKKLKVENVSSLDSIDLQVGTDEVLQLLRASLSSANVLTEVFGKALQVDSPHQLKPKDDAPLMESIDIARDWGRGLYNALREVHETAFHHSYVKEQEQDLNSPASTDSSRSSSCGTLKHIRKSPDGDYLMLPAPCKEMLMLEKQVDKVIARLCHLTSAVVEAPEVEVKHKPAAKPPWNMLQNSRIRLPCRVWRS